MASDPACAAGFVWYRVFDDAWESMASLGICDDWDSAEYWRVSAEWYEAGRPHGVHAFIRASANRPAPGAGGEQ